MKTWPLFVVSAAALAAGCASVSTHATTAPGANLARYQTYAWAEEPAGAVQTPADQQIRASIAQALGQKGMTTAPPGTRPDFLVAYQTAAQEKVNVVENGPWYHGYRSRDVESYTEGTLIVDFIDPATRQVFWRGTASSVVEHPDNPNPRKIAEAVAKLMKKYPGEVAATPRPAM